MDVKIYRVEGLIFKTKIIRRPSKKEGVITKRKVVYKFRKELLGISEKDVLERIYSILGGNFKVKKNRIKILSIKEITEDQIEDKKLKKFIESIKNGIY
ncbi:MAG: 50S ribosomal protein L18Ae [Nanopusillaceae archaeon]